MGKDWRRQAAMTCPNCEQLKREIKILRAGIGKIEDLAKFTSEPIYREVRFTLTEANSVRDERASTKPVSCERNKESQK